MTGLKISIGVTQFVVIEYVLVVYCPFQYVYCSPRNLGNVTKVPTRYTKVKEKTSPSR